MAKITADSGDRSADLTPKRAEALSIAMGGNQGVRVCDRLGIRQHMDSRLETNRLAPIPAASAIPAASSLAPASAMPPATPWPRLSSRLAPKDP